MFYPPTIPINILTFLILSCFWGGVSFAINRRLGDQSYKAWVLHLATGALGGLASLGLLTAASLIPDDWSACRLSWSGGLLCGYQLYSGESGPSNGFFYPPVGAWFYIPAAALGLLTKSAQVSLVFGWFMSLLCILLPMAFVLYRARGSVPFDQFLLAALPCIFVGLGFSLALPQLRYLATMVHVDSPALLFLSFSAILILPLCNDEKHLEKRVFLSGVLLAFSAMTKQSAWPLVPVVTGGCLAFHGWKNTLKFLSGGIIATSVIILSFFILGENFYEAFKMVWYWPMRQASITPVIDCILQTWNVNFPIICALTIITIVVLVKKIKNHRSYLKSIYFCLLLGFWAVPFSILTRTKIGADSNHLALPSFFFLIAFILLFYKLLIDFERKSLFSVCVAQFAIVILLSISLVPYYKTYCGWYLWINNPHSQALKYEFQSQSGNSNSKLYFPWQVFSTLIATGKLYHIDDCLRYEEAAGWVRSSKSLKKYLPQAPFKIPLRPFGASSYLVEKMGFQKWEQDPYFSKWLPNWEIYCSNK